MREKKSSYNAVIFLAGLTFIFEIVGTMIHLLTNTIVFAYYTVDSNVLTLLSCSCLLVWALCREDKDLSKMPYWLRMLRYLSAVQLALTFLVVVFVLAPTGEDGYRFSMLTSGASLFHHTLCPAFTIFSVLFLEKGQKLTRKDNVLAVIPTLIYAVILVILNYYCMVDGPYPFLMVHEQSVMTSVIWFIGILCFVFLLGLGIRKVQEKRR